MNRRVRYQTPARSERQREDRDVRKSLILTTILIALGVACGGTTESTSPDATATRSAEQTAVATIQSGIAASSTETTQDEATSTSSLRIESTAISVATATAEPTRTPTALPTATPEPTPTQEPTGDFFSLLPTIDSVPAGFALTTEEELTAPNIAATHPDPDTSLDRLHELGFIGGASRTFEVPSPGLNDAMQRMVIFKANVYEFETPDGADGYIDFNRDIVKAEANGEILDVSVDKIRDRSAGVQGTLASDDAEAIVAMIWVRDGRLIYRFQGVSLGYNSLPDLIEAAQRLFNE